MEFKKTYGYGGALTPDEEGGNDSYVYESDFGLRPSMIRNNHYGLTTAIAGSPANSPEYVVSGSHPDSEHSGGFLLGGEDRRISNGMVMQGDESQSEHEYDEHMSYRDEQHMHIDYDIRADNKKRRPEITQVIKL